jgi:hypothetical protein
MVPIRTNVRPNRQSSKVVTIGKKKLNHDNLDDEFITDTSPKGYGCVVCRRIPPITEEVVGIIELAFRTGRGPITTLNWLRKKGLWPEPWSEQRIKKHWSHQE